MKFPGGGGMGQMMAQAQKMQAQMKAKQEELSLQEMDFESAGGRIKLRVNGKQEVLSLEIDKEIIDPGDSEMLCDLVMVAVNEAMTGSQEMVNKEMSKLIPPGMAGLLG